MARDSKPTSVGGIEPAEMLAIIERAAEEHGNLQLEFAEFKQLASNVFDQHRDQRLTLESRVAALQVENLALKAQLGSTEEEARTSKVDAWNFELRLWQAKEGAEEVSLRLLQLERQNEELQGFLSEVSQSLRAVSDGPARAWNQAVFSLPLDLALNDPPPVSRTPLMRSVLGGDGV